jgi:hypothetical protein
VRWKDMEPGDTLVHDFDVITVLFVDAAKDHIDLMLHSDARVYRCKTSKLVSPLAGSTLYKGRMA